MKHFPQLLIKRFTGGLRVQDLTTLVTRTISADLCTPAHFLQSMVFVEDYRFGRASCLIDPLALNFMRASAREEALLITSHLSLHLLVRLLIRREISFLGQTATVDAPLLRVLFWGMCNRNLLLTDVSSILPEHTLDFSLLVRLKDRIKAVAATG